MKGMKLIIFAVLMSLCTSAFVSAFIIMITLDNSSFFFPWFERFLIAWPTVFLCIVFFAPRINNFVNNLFKKNDW